MVLEISSPDSNRLIGKIKKAIHGLVLIILQEELLLPCMWLRSLCYFEDAEKEPMPNMLTACDWQEVKGYFVNEVKRLSRIL